MEWRIHEKGTRCFGHRWGRNGELCAAVGPSTRTAVILVIVHASLV